MSGKKAIMEALKKALGDSLNEDVANDISTYLDELVTDRAAASTDELAEQVKTLKKENAVLKKTVQTQESEFKSEAEKFASELSEAFAQKEKILFEELENYKAETVRVVEETASQYRAMVEEMVIAEASEYRTSLEQVMVESAKDFRLKQEAALAQDVSAYQTDLLGKLDEFIEAELPNSLPEGLIEAAAKASALESIVEGVVGVFDNNYIKLDESSVEALKEARSEQEQLAESYNAKVKEAVALTAKVRELEKEVKFNKLTEGMTQDQKKRAKRLLESASANDIERKFEGVKDFIIKESVTGSSKKKPVARRPQNESKKQQLTEHAQKQVEKIEESIQAPKEASTGFGNEMASWRKSLDRMNRR
jgi:hypothetical protein